jgi:hypothetical protein
MFSAFKLVLVWALYCLSPQALAVSTQAPTGQPSAHPSALPTPIPSPAPTVSTVQSGSSAFKHKEKVIYASFGFLLGLVCAGLMLGTYRQIQWRHKVKPLMIAAEAAEQEAQANALRDFKAWLKCAEEEGIAAAGGGPLHHNSYAAGGGFGRFVPRAGISAGAGWQASTEEGRAAEALLEATGGNIWDEQKTGGPIATDAGAFPSKRRVVAPSIAGSVHTASAARQGAGVKKPRKAAQGGKLDGGSKFLSLGDFPGFWRNDSS